MRQAIIETLSFPKTVIAKYINVDNCPHGGYFNPAESDCEHCARHGECHWIFQNEESTALENKPLEELISALEYSISFIELRISHQGHHAGNCQCESCLWLKKASTLFNQALLKV